MVKIFSLNCNGLKDPKRVELLKERLKQHKVDICFLQETRVDNINLGRSIQSVLDGKVYWSLTDNRGKGVGIYIRNSFDCYIKGFRFDLFGRYVYVDIDFENYSFRLINVYAPTVPKERKTFFHEMYSVLLCARPIILGGDFNCVENPSLDKRGGNPDRGREGWKELSSLINDFDLVDCFRYLYPSLKQYTWRRRDVSCRLDRFYFSSCLKSALTEIRHMLYPHSDHLFVALTLSSFNHIKMGSSYWKFNNNLLQDMCYVDYMKLILKDFTRNLPTDDNFLVWWDNFKLFIKNQTILFSKNKKKRENFELNLLRKEYFTLDKQGDWEGADIVKQRLIAFHEEELRGSQIRSKAEMLSQGEKPTRFFLRKELFRGKRKVIREIINLRGEKCTSTQSISTAFSDFYKQLFSKEPINNSVVDDLLNNLPKITSEDSEGLGTDVRADEVETALSNMCSAKSPGSDGLSKEFYVEFRDILLPVLVKLYNVIYISGKLSSTQKLSYISLICKDDDNSHLLTNYRPISLLNVDYKILTKVMCNRLKLVLHQVIHEDQTCAVPDRSIIDSCHLVRDIIDYYNDRNLPGVLLSLDQEKAFDRVSHDYLFRVLEAFGLGDRFTRWIKTFYADISSCIIVNQFISEPFSVTRSVRQGCSLSPLLYVLCLEPILIKIRKDDSIKGVKIPGQAEEQKTAAFADDSNFFLTNDESARKVIYWFDYFGKGSGSKLNKGKSKGLYFGKWKTRSDHPFGISWVEKIKIFGVWYGKITIEEVWTPVFNKIKKTLDLYRGRILSIYGRAVIVNTMILSKLWYLASVVNLPDSFIRKVEKEIFSFFWSSKTEFLARTTLQLPREKGGINVINIRLKIASIQLSQICKIIFDNSTLGWVKFGHIWLGLRLIRFSDYKFTNSIPHRGEHLPAFYQALSTTLTTIFRDFPSLSVIKGAKCKSFYKQLLKHYEVLPKVVSTFPQINFIKVFGDLCNRCIDPLTFTVSYKLAHNVLPVAHHLYMYNMPLDKRCTFCKREVETIPHLFYYCPYVQRSKRFIVKWFRDIANQSISLECVRFSVFNVSFSNEKKTALLVILAEYRFSVWQCRNEARFDKKHIKPIDITARFLARIKHRLMLDFSRLQEHIFRSIWVVDTLCSISPEGLNYCFSIEDKLL